MVPSVATEKNPQCYYKYILVFMQSTRYSYQLLKKLEFSGQIFEKYSNIKSFQWEPICSMRRDGTDTRIYEANSPFSKFRKCA